MEHENLNQQRSHQHFIDNLCRMWSQDQWKYETMYADSIKSSPHETRCTVMVDNGPKKYIKIKQIKPFQVGKHIAPDMTWV